jgi:hypothetical protein
MVIPLGAPKVADLVHHSLEPIVHSLWLFSFVVDESIKFSLNCFPLGNLSDFVTFGALRTSQFFGTLQSLHPVILLPKQGSEEYGGGLGVEAPHLGSLIDVIVFISTCGAYAPNSTIF